jgi:hypothetical protein
MSGWRWGTARVMEVNSRAGIVKLYRTCAQPMRVVGQAGVLSTGQTGGSHASVRWPAEGVRGCMHACRALDLDAQRRI